MSILIKNATIINANNTQKANILIKNNKITADRRMIARVKTELHARKLNNK